jgi:hypothetical protein
MFADRRQGTREPITLRLALDQGVEALTRDIGPQGLYFHMPFGHVLDTWVRVELDLADAGLHLSALGEVMRLERTPQGIGVALRLHRQHLHPRD